MFAQNQFEKAVDFYTKALEINDENHIYYANSKCHHILIKCCIFTLGANAYLEWGKM